MFGILHLLLVATYISLPVAAMIVALVRRAKTGRSDWLWATALASGAGVGVGLALSLLFARLAGGGPPVSQVLLAGYFGIGLLLILRGFDAGLLWIIRRVLSRGQRDPDRLLPALFGGLLRAGLLFAVGLPFVVAAVATYRTKTVAGGDPLVDLNLPFERVRFTATDGTDLVGWWIPADRPNRRERRDPQWGKVTVIACHGLGSGKLTELEVVGRMPHYGFNVFVFDFRGHGESDGQLTSFGDAERNDVLGAVRWVKREHADAAERVVGVGSDLGGAALIAAAADPGREGQAIEALVVSGSYDDLSLLADEMSHVYFAPPLDWLMRNMGVPLASVYAGRDLRAFSPARLSDAIWPRPMLVLHSRNDDMIAFDRGQRLFDQISGPKASVWVDRGGRKAVMTDQATTSLIMFFLWTAAPTPII